MATSAGINNLDKTIEVMVRAQRQAVTYGVTQEELDRQISLRLDASKREAERGRTGTPLDVEVATIRGQQSSTGREILESNASSWLEADYRRERRALPASWSLVRTGQQRGAIAVYLCEAGSDDGLLACGLVPDTSAGAEFPAWRVHAVE